MCIDCLPCAVERQIMITHNRLCQCIAQTPHKHLLPPISIWFCRTTFQFANHKFQLVASTATGRIHAVARTPSTDAAAHFHDFLPSLPSLTLQMHLHTNFTVFRWQFISELATGYERIARLFVYFLTANNKSQADRPTMLYGRQNMCEQNTISLLLTVCVLQ